MKLARLVQHVRSAELDSGGPDGLSADNELLAECGPHHRQFLLRIDCEGDRPRVFSDVSLVILGSLGRHPSTHEMLVGEPIEDAPGVATNQSRCGVRRFLSQAD